MDIYDRARESADDYLKTIFILSEDNSKPVRVTDIARLMGYTKASVSRAVRNLLCEGRITLTPNKRVLLTPTDGKTADDEACRMEHAICTDSFEKLKRLLGETKQEPCECRKAPIKLLNS